MSVFYWLLESLGDSSNIQNIDIEIFGTYIKYFIGVCIRHLARMGLLLYNVALSWWEQLSPGICLCMRGVCMIHTWKWVGACSHGCTCKGQSRMLDVFSCTLLCCHETGAFHESEAGSFIGWLANELSRSTCLHTTPHVRVTGTCSLYTGAGNQNSGFHAYRASMLTDYSISSTIFYF